MGKISEALTYGLTIRESADDGSDFTNPSADYRRLFLGEDGQLHVKDSAGAVTAIGAASGSVATDAIWDAAGDLAVGSGANTAAKLTKGTDGKVLTMVGGAVAWATPTGGITRTTAGTLTDGGSYDATYRGYLKKITLATDGLVASIMAMVKGNANNNSSITCAIFTDSSGPANVIATSAAIKIDVDTTAVNNIGMSATVRSVAIPIGAWLVAGDYWIGIYTNSDTANALYLAYASGTGTDHTQALKNPGDGSVWATSLTDDDYSIAANILR